MKNYMAKNSLTYIKWTHLLKEISTKTHEETDNSNRLVSVKEIDSLINILSKQQQDQTDSLMNSIKHLMKKLYQISAISSRGQKQRKYFLTHSMSPPLP